MKTQAKRGGERGDSLVMALVALAAGTLIVMPFLMFATARQKQSLQIQTNAHRQYASDAGAKLGLWELAYDPALRTSLGAMTGTLQSLSCPAVVYRGTTLTPTLEVVCLTADDGGSGGEGEGGGGAEGEGELLEWVIWGDSVDRSNTVQFTGSGHQVYGGVHSNNQLKIGGSGHLIYHGSSVVESVDTISVVGSGHQIIPGPATTCEVKPFPVMWDIADFQPGGRYALEALAEGKYYVHTSNWSFSGSNKTLPEGLHYCEAKANISGSGHTGRVTIVSPSTINVSGSGHEFTPYIPGLNFFSTKSSTANVVSISGSGNMGGTCYAPDGKISLTGSGGMITGAFLGNVVKISGSGAMINLAEVYIEDEGDEEGGGDELVEWALWANTELLDDAVYLYGSGHRVYGDVHSNKDIHIFGSDDDIHGDVERVGQILDEGSGNDIVPGPATVCGVGDYPVSWDVADFAPGGQYAVAAAAEGHYYAHEGYWEYCGAGLEIPEGIHYATGNVKICGSALTGNVTIVSEGEILVDGSGHSLTAYHPGLSLFSTKSSADTVAEISGSGTISMGGVVYAPNGRIRVYGSGITVGAALLGDRIEINGSAVTIDNEDGILVPGDGQGGSLCGIYDIRCTVEGSVTTARVRICEGDTVSPEILSWYVD